MKTIPAFLVYYFFLFPVFLLHAQAPSPSPSVMNPANTQEESGRVERSPFTLRLPLDKGQVYEVKLDKVAYIDGGSIFLFNGDHFGVKIERLRGKVTHLIYEPNPEKADVSFRFYQEEQDEKKISMLAIRNNTEQRLLLDAAIMLPKQTVAKKTPILPVGPGMADFEAWSYPVVQIEIYNIRLQD